MCPDSLIPSARVQREKSGSKGSTLSPVDRENRVCALFASLSVRERVTDQTGAVQVETDGCPTGRRQATAVVVGAGAAAAAARLQACVCVFGRET